MHLKSHKSIGNWVMICHKILFPIKRLKVFQKSWVKCQKIFKQIQSSNRFLTKIIESTEIQTNDWLKIFSDLNWDNILFKKYFSGFKSYDSVTKRFVF